VFVSNASQAGRPCYSMVANLRPESIPALLPERRKIIDGGELRAVLQRPEGALKNALPSELRVLM